MLILLSAAAQITLCQDNKKAEVVLFYLYSLSQYQNVGGMSKLFFKILRSFFALIFLFTL
jgi:hypothetical protein